jgi:hypothetical protein
MKNVHHRGHARARTKGKGAASTLMHDVLQAEIQKEFTTEVTEEHGGNFALRFDAEVAEEGSGELFAQVVVVDAHDIRSNLQFVTFCYVPLRYNSPLP